MTWYKNEQALNFKKYWEKKTIFLIEKKIYNFETLVVKS